LQHRTSLAHSSAIFEPDTEVKHGEQISTVQLFPVMGKKSF